ncbi:hypothetical protein PAXRUDRAFT_161735, partial [Paxillus rubicundulus Ve08.2h10]
VLLFFFSYAGLLPEKESSKGDTRGFVQPLEWLAHMRCWPERHAKWAGGNLENVEHTKSVGPGSAADELLRSTEVKCSLKENRASGLHEGIRILLAWSRRYSRTADTIP